MAIVFGSRMAFAAGSTMTFRGRIDGDGRPEEMPNTRMNDIEHHIQPTLQDRGYTLVDASWQSGCLTLLVERTDGVPIQLSECIELNRLLSVVLGLTEESVQNNPSEDTDPEKGPRPSKEEHKRAGPTAKGRGLHGLEVSSPGVERPLKKPEDFLRFEKNPVLCELHDPMEGRRTLRGYLENVDGQGFCVRLHPSEGATSSSQKDQPVVVGPLMWKAVRRCRLDPFFNMSAPQRSKGGPSKKGNAKDRTLKKSR